MFLQLRQQIDFLLEIDAATSNPNLLLLQAITAKQKGGNAESLLTAAIELKLKTAESYRFGLEYLIHLDVTFILDALKRFSSVIPVWYSRFCQSYTRLISNHFYHSE